MIAFITLGIVILALGRYVIAGRFHRIAYLRRSKVRLPLIDQCKTVVRKLAIFTVHHPLAPKVFLNDKPRVKVLVFLTIGLVAGLIGFIFHYLSFFLQIFFVALIIFRGYNFDLNVDFLGGIDAFVQRIFQYVPNVSQYAIWVLYPFVQLLTIISEININFGSLAVSVQNKERERDRERF